MKYGKSVLILFFLLYNTVKCFASDATITEREISYFETGNELSLNSAIDYFKTHETPKTSASFLNLGLVSNNLWIHITSKASNAKEQNYVVFDNSRLNILHCYFVQSNSIVDSIITGDFYPFSTRKSSYPNFRFQIPETFDSTIEVYCMIDHKGSTLQLPIQILTLQKMIDDDRSKLLFDGIKMGVFIIALFFGLFLFAATHNKTYLFYSLYVFVAATWLWSTEGYGFQYIWKNHPQLNNRVEASFGVFYAGTFIAYALQFTKTYKLDKSFYRTISKYFMWAFFLWGSIPLLPFILISYNTSTPIFLYSFFLINILAAIFVFGYFIQLIKENGKPVLFFLFAVFNTILFSILVAGFNLGMFSLPISTSNLVGLGMIIDIVFMTFGLAYQFNQYKLDKEKILLEYLEQEKNINTNIIKMQEEERRRISREMHDDIGAGLTRITMMSESAKIKKDNLKEVNEIAFTSRKIVASLSEIIWSMQPSNNNLEQLFVHLKEQLSELLEYTSIKYSIELPSAFLNQKLSSNTTRNVILMCKEVVHNAIKYSQCNCLSFSIILLENTLVIKIVDDGIGFDIAQKSKGNGLNNIQHRLKQINSTVNITSSDSGTIFVFNIPIS